MLGTVLLICALVCAVCAAFGVPARVGLGWLSLAFYFASLLLR